MAYDILMVGGDGDLALRKLYPALFALEIAGQLDDVASITGLSRKVGTREELLERMLPWLKAQDGFCEATWEKFQPRIKCLKGDATQVETVLNYKETLSAGSEGLIVYLAVPPKVFGGACRSLKEAGLAIPSTRLVVEKPLGSDRESFLAVNAEMSAAFDETQIYRIDHYLGKEAVQNLLSLRFANLMLGSLWDGNYIDHVQITVAERVGVEGRKEFYDEIGALRDMVQNHLVQILCLVAMEPPGSRDAFMIRAEKLKVLKCLKPLVGEAVKRNTVRGQYVDGTIDGNIVPSYSSEVGDERKSNTETFVAIKAEIDNWRWAGVPFYLRTGKRMQRRTSEILIQFKNPKHNIFSPEGYELSPNQLRIELQPNEGIELHILSKRPGLGELVMEDVKLNLTVPESRKKASYDAYARLLREVLNGDQTLFVSAEEVEASWAWIDEIVAEWQRTGMKAKPYAAGSSGPVDAAVMIAQDGREWSDLNA